MRDIFIPNEPKFTPVKPIGKKSWRLDNELTYYDPLGNAWTAPKDTLTDFASIPRILQPLIGEADDPRYIKASVVHDYFCEKADKSKTSKDRHEYRVQIDWMFYHACVCGGCSSAFAQKLLLGVRIGAIFLSPKKFRTQVLEHLSQAEVDAKALKIYQELEAAQNNQEPANERKYGGFPKATETFKRDMNYLERKPVNAGRSGGLLVPEAAETFTPNIDFIDTQILQLLEKEGLSLV
jgi:hypothetical protein